MEITLLGQAGAFVRLEDGTGIAVDPYLSDSLHALKGERFARRVPESRKWRAQAPDIIAVTHDHMDHLDMETLGPWLDGGARKQVLGPYPVCEKICGKWPGRHNTWVMRPGVEVTLGGVRFSAVPAAHETEHAVGYLAEAEGKSVYFTGDTLFDRRIPAFFAGRRIDLMLVCINGTGNNMNCADAARLAGLLRPAAVIPVHWDMFGPFGADPAEFVRELGGAVPVRVMEAYSSLRL